MNSLHFWVPMMSMSTNDHSISAKKVEEVECFLGLTYSQVPMSGSPNSLGDWEISEGLISGVS